MRKCNMRWFSPQRMKKHLAFALAVSLIAMVPVSAFAKDFNDEDKRIHRECTA